MKISLLAILIFSLFALSLLITLVALIILCNPRISEWIVNNFAEIDDSMEEWDRYGDS